MDLNEIIERELPKMPGWCTVEKAKRMAELSTGASLCVELGVFGGRGLAAMALALAKQGFGRADGIDPYSASAALEGVNSPENDEWWSKLDYSEISRVAQLSLCELGLYHCSRIIRLTSKEAVEFYGDHVIDVLHQDSNHSEQISRQEVELWAPKMESGGIWISDDTDWSTTKKAQEDLEAKGFVLLEDHEIWKVYRAP